MQTVRLVQEAPNRFRPTCDCGWSSAKRFPACRVTEYAERHCRAHARRGIRAVVSWD